MLKLMKMIAIVEPDLSSVFNQAGVKFIKNANIYIYQAYLLALLAAQGALRAM